MRFLAGTAELKKYPEKIKNAFPPIQNFSYCIDCISYRL